MNIVFLKNVLLDGSRYVVGDEIDVSDDVAQQLIHDGLAKSESAKPLEEKKLKPTKPRKTHTKPTTNSAGIEAAFAGLPDLGEG